MAEEAVLRLAEISRISDQLKEKRDGLNSEAQDLVKERDRLNALVAEWLGKARTHREKRDEYNQKVAEFKVNETIKRAKENILRRRNANCSWFGPVHGGKYKELLKRSSLEMSNLDFAVYAIGGLVKAFLDSTTPTSLKLK